MPQELRAKSRWSPFFLRRLLPRRAATAEQLNVELATLQSLASFLRAHPDMPASHRARFLDHMVAGCQALRDAAGATATGTPGL